MDWDGGGGIPSGGKQGATHEKVIKQDAHQWTPQAEAARRRTSPEDGTRGVRGPPDKRPRLTSDELDATSGLSLPTPAGGVLSSRREAEVRLNVGR